MNLFYFRLIRLLKQRAECTYVSNGYLDCGNVTVVRNKRCLRNKTTVEPYFRVSLGGYDDPLGWMGYEVYFKDLTYTELLGDSLYLSHINRINILKDAYAKAWGAYSDTVYKYRNDLKEHGIVPLRY